MALAAYVTEDGLVSHSMGGESLGPVKVLCHSIGKCQGQEEGLGGLMSWGGGEEAKGQGVFRGETMKAGNI